MNVVLGSKKNEDAKALRGSLKWLQKHYVISEEENELIFSIRKRRNTLVHELLKEIGNGLDEQDIQMIVKLLKLQQRINAWRVKQIDMPIMEIKLPKEVKPDDVMGGDDAVLESMFRILFCGEGPQFKEKRQRRVQTGNEPEYGRRNQKHNTAVVHYCGLQFLYAEG